jgi:hypothetical protein
MAYVQLTDQTESARNTRKRIYKTLVNLEKTGKPDPDMRVEKLYLETQWDTV